MGSSILTFKQRVNTSGVNFAAALCCAWDGQILFARLVVLVWWRLDEGVMAINDTIVLFVSAKGICILPHIIVVCTTWCGFCFSR